MAPSSLKVAHAHQVLLSAIKSVTPLWEPVRPGHVFLDLSGTSRLFGSTCDTAVRVEREMARCTGLHAVARISTNKLVAQMATTVLTSSQVCEVCPGSEPNFLRPLSISAFPGVRGPQAVSLRSILADLNLRIVQDLADATLDALESVFGRWAIRLYHWVRGVDSSPVLLPDRLPTVMRLCLFEPDTVEWPCLVGELSRLTDQVCHELRRHDTSVID